jgi:hypothetical protein
VTGRIGACCERLSIYEDLGAIFELFGIIADVFGGITFS